MMDVVRQWLVGVTCAALLAALAEGLMPKGPVRRVGKLVCAMVLLWAVLDPLPGLELPDAGGMLDGLGAQMEQEQRRLRQDSAGPLKAGIEQEVAAYIVDKAAELGASCRAQVVCREQEGAWVPWSVQVEGALSAAVQSELSGLITRELAVPAQRQSWLGGEGG